MVTTFRIAAALGAMALAAGSASAAVIQADFDDGSLLDGVYVQGEFRFTSSGRGGVSLATCAFTSSTCLQFNNNEVITVTRAGGAAFDATAFLFRATGKSATLTVSGGGIPQSLAGSKTGHAMTQATLGDGFKGITSFMIGNSGNGQGFVDGLWLAVADAPPPAPAPALAAIPLPTGAVLLLTALAGLAAARRSVA